MGRDYILQTKTVGIKVDWNIITLFRCDYFYVSKSMAGEEVVVVGCAHHQGKALAIAVTVNLNIAPQNTTGKGIMNKTFNKTE